MRKCLDSILAQTYADLEILVIDDGSTDRCGEICDSYAERDPRIRVFHTENRGLSAARNLGLDNARGEYIGFVDSDDWIEPNMYETLLRKAEETGADIVECSYYSEPMGNAQKPESETRVMSGMEAVKALLKRELLTTVWNKIWKRHLFDTTRFPTEKICEDVAVTYRLLISANKVCVLPTPQYHYLHREGSITQNRNMKLLSAYWFSNKERYDFLWDKVDENSKKDLLQFCALAVARTWAYYRECSKTDQGAYREAVREMNAFAKSFLPMFGERQWPLVLRLGVLFPHFNHSLSFNISWTLNTIRKRIQRAHCLTKRKQK